MKIRFNINYHTVWGEQLYVVGSGPELGLWDESRARVMSYIQGDEWKLEINLPDRKDAEFTYRYIVKNDKGAVICEGGEPRAFSPDGADITEPYDMVEVRDWWRPLTDHESLFLTSAFTDVVFKRDTDTEKKRPEPLPGAKLVIRLKILVPRIEPGHSLFVTGSIPALGDSDVSKAVPMDPTGFPAWKLDIPIEGQMAAFTYKYLIKDKKGKVVFVDEGKERVVAVNADYRIEKKLCMVNDFAFRYLNKWRGAGVAVPVFSLRSANSLGIGEFLDIKPLADWASQCGLKLIQILPVNDTSVTMTWWDSYPYGNLSVFALHPIYMNIPAIGALPKSVGDEAASQAKILNGYDHINYDEVIALKLKLLRQIFQSQKTKFLASVEFKAFLEENAFWLKPYAAFSALRDTYKTSDFTKWEKYACGTPDAINELTSENSSSYDSIAFYYFIQYHLHLQLSEASKYAASKGVILKGDIPIGIHKESDSCWTSPELFNMDQSAGAPPDPFSDVGQNWGFPTYNWDAMAKDNYLWWRRRLQKMSEYFQMTRLDHVLGFFRIWEIPQEMVSGLMGHFNPAIPLSQQELERNGIWDFNRLCDPYIPSWLVKIAFGNLASKVIGEYLEDAGSGRYRLKAEYKIQAAVEAHLASPENAPQDQKDRNSKIRDGLFALISNIILFRDGKAGGFHPRINLMDTCSFDTLDEHDKEKLIHFYFDYFYHRQEDFWRKQAMIKLPVIKAASRMLIAGEDLGMIPDCVPKVMEELSILGLRIQRMPKETDREFGYPYQYPYLTVCTTSSHDMSTIRGWWGEDYARTQRYYNTILGHSGDAPSAFSPAICKEIISQHLDAPSMWAIFPIQDILAMSSELCRPGDPREEQINDPANPHHYWKFRLHIAMEKLLAKKEFNAELSEMVCAAGRGISY
jgi:4-alpha-glucanotransferase